MVRTMVLSSVLCSSLLCTYLAAANEALSFEKYKLASLVQLLKKAGDGKDADVRQIRHLITSVSLAEVQSDVSAVEADHLKAFHTVEWGESNPLRFQLCGAYRTWLNLTGQIERQRLKVLALAQLRKMKLLAEKDDAALVDELKNTGDFDVLLHR